MGEHHSTELLPADFAVTDVYRETFEDLYRKLLDEAAYLYHRGKNKLWEIDGKDIANYHHVLAVINEFRETMVNPMMANPELDPYVTPGAGSNVRTKALLDYVRVSCVVCLGHNGPEGTRSGRRTQGLGVHVPRAVLARASKSGRQTADRRETRRVQASSSRRKCETCAQPESRIVRLA